MKKKISIITVVRNDFKGLKETYESIKLSLCDEIEWIVIDGKSNDGSVVFLQQLNNPFLTWISESDKNMYEGMNKGIRLAEGTYLQFLNAGDVLTKPLKDFFLTKKSEADLIFYNISKFDESNNKINWELPQDFLSHLPMYASVPHQSTFIKKDLFNEIGIYREDVKYLGDYEFFCRAIYHPTFKPTFEYRLETNLVSFICNGVTFNYKLSLELMKESAYIQKMYFNKVNTKTRVMYMAKYLLSFLPGYLKIAGFMRQIIKH
jgi:glycosyltransferase involved in cell wall biosynthesis